MARGLNIRDGLSRLPPDQQEGPRTVRLGDAVRIAPGAQVIANPSASRSDGFGNSIVASVFPLFNASQSVDIGVDLFYTAQSAGGTFTTVVHGANEASTVLSLSDGGVSPNNAYALRCTRYIPYIDGCGQRAEVGFVMATAIPNSVQEVGHFEAPNGVATNGVFLRLTTAGLYLVLIGNLTGQVEQAVIRSSWNGEDLADFEPTVRSIIGIDTQWMGGGAVRVFLDLGGGDIRLAHTFDNVQTGTLPYMRSATLPVTWLIRATGNVAAKISLRQVSCAVKSHGAVEIPGQNRVVGRGATALAGVLARVPFVSFRCASAYVPAIVQSVEMAVQLNPARWDLVLNGTLGVGTAWGALTGTRLEIDTGSTTLTGGQTAASGFLHAGASRQFSAPGAASRALHEKVWASISPQATKDIITLAVQGLGAAANVYADLQVLEVL